MKKIKLFSLLFFIAIIGAVFVGCSSDDNDDAANTNDLVGYWIRYDGDDMEELGFFEDGTCNYEETYDDGEEMEFGKGTYALKGNKLTMKLTFGNETEVWEYTVKSLTNKKKLVLVDEDGDYYTFDYYKE